MELEALKKPSGSLCESSRFDLIAMLKAFLAALGMATAIPEVAMYGEPG